MTGRPVSVTLVGYLFVAAGVVGLVYHGLELRQQLRFEDALVLTLRLVAVVCGVFILRGAQWARWLALAWLGYHVVLSGLHSWSEAATHLVLLLALGFVLLRPVASAYFRHTARR